MQTEVVSIKLFQGFTCHYGKIPFHYCQLSLILYNCRSYNIQSTLSKQTLSKADTSLNRTANLVHSLPNCTCISVTELSLKRTPL